MEALEFIVNTMFYNLVADLLLCLLLNIFKTKWAAGLYFKQHDIWIGIYWKKQHNILTIYTCPIPMVCFRFTKYI